MDAEILFFMTAKDQSDFLELVNEKCDLISEDSEENRIIFHVGACRIFYSPSLFEKNILYAGKLEIRLSSVSENVETTDNEHAETTFRELRNWIKKNYWSRLAYLNQNKNNKLTPSRNYWLGPDAKRWKLENDDHILKLSKTNWMVFEIGY